MNIRSPKTKFIKVKCNNCGNEQNIFSAATTDIKCLVCNTVLAESTASKTNIKTKILQVQK